MIMKMLKTNSKAIKKSGFTNGQDISICLDVAANELYKNKNIQFIQKNLFQ